MKSKLFFIVILFLISELSISQINYSGTSISGTNSSAIGFQTTVNGTGSFIGGFNSQASGNGVFCYGTTCNASGNASVALGFASWTMADKCIAIGENAIAGTINTGTNAIAIGNLTTASGAYSLALGNRLNANNTNSIIIGRGYSETQYLTAPANSFAVGINSTVPTFFVGNSTGGATGTGKVGIATTTPGSKLQINGNAAIGYSVSTTAPANGLLISGNTGIGTATVGSKLQINGNAAIGYSSSTSAPANGALIAGNVGIGTNNPGAYKLSVNGDVNLLSDNSLNALQILSNGQVPDRRGISLTNDPAGDFNFYICSWQNNAGFNFINKINNTVIMSVKAENNTLSLGNSIKMYGNDGYIWAKEVTVKTDNPYPDYVFGDDYQLMKMDELKDFIKTHRHLPNIPSAGEIAEKGIDMGKMNILMMEKIEELTLYILQQNEKIQQMQQQIDALKK